MTVSGHGGSPRLRPGRVLVAGVVLTTAATVFACRSQPADDFGSPPVTTPAASTAAAAPAPARVPVTDGRPPAAATTDAPARLRIPALGLDTAVDAVGLDPKTGDFAVPPSVDRVGWYRFGPDFSAPAGSIVIAGHVDAAGQGEGAFFKLGSLTAGDTVVLAGAGARTRTFEVVARERHTKTAIPLDGYFARDGAARLTLITCGGPFDAATRHYRDNVVVTAVARP
ncbi:class F sortase [Actinoplanes sp. NEAU-A12]|uniref:Class F sortase n=1 Tax=Actinoplanes sandaracinus TaxID=3045177 RepID=A0ABT6WHX5_9ACTN|nr:class F sortase [Actinoplanes sandaracinus]MDI6099332.1 class F sortase [Actinoplanes sandaracinus]